MDAIMTLLTDNFGPFGPLLAVGGLGLVLVLATLPTLMKKRIDPLDKLKKSRVEPNEGQGQVGIQKLQDLRLLLTYRW